MGKSKSTKKRAAKAGKPAVKKAEKKPHREDLCVFAFRLTPKEREDIHKAAGPGKASKFVRTLAVAAAKNDAATVKAIMEGVQTKK